MTEEIFTELLHKRHQAIKYKKACLCLLILTVDIFTGSNDLFL